MKVLSPLFQYFKDTFKTRPVGCIEGEYQKYVGLNVKTTTLGTPIYFDSDTETDNSILRTIEVVTSTQNAVVDYNGAAYDNITTAMAAQAFFVLSNDAREIIAEIPLSVMIRATNAGKPTYFRADNVVWQNCYIYLVDATSYATTNGFNIRVTFDKKS